jgi:hypothetical protein
MTSPFAAVLTFVVGVLLALGVTVGGVAALTSSKNPSSASETVVTYDGS